MKRLALVLGIAAYFSTPSFAISEFGKQWKADYITEETDADFVKATRKAGCNLCHVKGAPEKKEARNEYGRALHKLLDKKDFPKEYFKEHPEEAAAKISAAFKKVAEEKSKDGKTFGEKIKANELPATDAGL